MSQSTRANLSTLPVDIQIIIVDFLSIDECFTLMNVNKKFFESLRLPNAFWAQKLFQKHIQIPNKTINMFKSSGSKLPYYFPSSEEFNNFPKGLFYWQELMSKQEALISSFSVFGLDFQKSQHFTNRIYRIIVDPWTPIPSLKRENQIIPTSSSFENFLTEIHFDITPTPKLYDRDYLFLEEATDVIKADFAAIQDNNNKNFKLNKRKDNRKNRKMQKSMQKNKAHNIRKAIKERIHVQKVQNIYYSIQEVLKTHCTIIGNYLVSLNQDRILLEEYSRCWDEFTYSMIELHELIQPYEDLFGGAGAFSTWGGMVKLWIDEVYDKVSTKTKESFQNLLINMIKKEVVSNGLAKNQEGEGIEQINNENIIQTLLKFFIDLSDISLWRTDFQEYITNDLLHSQPKLKLLNFIYPHIKHFVEKTLVAFEEDPYKTIEAINRIKCVFNSVFNEEIFMEEVSKGNELGDYSIDKSQLNPFQEIAGRYKIISRCKWGHRLSEVYESINNFSIY